MVTDANASQLMIVGHVGLVGLIGSILDYQHQPMVTDANALKTNLPLMPKLLQNQPIIAGHVALDTHIGMILDCLHQPMVTNVNVFILLQLER